MEEWRWSEGMVEESIERVKISDIKGALFELRVDEGAEEIKELAESLKKTGQVQPIILRRTKEGLFLIAGARRLAAAKLAGLETIQARILAGTELEALEVALTENLHRKELTPGELILSLKQASERFQISIATLLEHINYGRTQIHVYQKLMQTDEEILDALVKGKISLNVAYEISKVASKTFRRRYLEYALSGGATAQTIRNWRQQEEEAIKIAVAEEHGIELPSSTRQEMPVSYSSTQYSGVGRTDLQERTTEVDQFVCLMDRQKHPAVRKRVMVICERCYNQILETLGREE